MVFLGVCLEVQNLLDVMMMMAFFCCFFPSVYFNILYPVRGTCFWIPPFLLFCSLFLWCFFCGSLETIHIRFWFLSLSFFPLLFLLGLRDFMTIGLDDLHCFFLLTIPMSLLHIYHYPSYYTTICFWVFTMSSLNMI